MFVKSEVTTEDGLDTTGRNQHAALRTLIADKKAKVGIIGLGYVGLPLARAFTDKGIAVLG